MSWRPEVAKDTPREQVQCDRPGCGAWYEAGHYSQHVRESTKSGHERDRGLRVPFVGGPSCEGSVGPRTELPEVAASPGRPPFSQRKRNAMKKAADEKKRGARPGRSD